MESLSLFVAVGGVFAVLARFCNITQRAPFFTRELARNLFYYLLSPIYSIALSLLVIIALFHFGKDDAQITHHLQHGASWVQGWALWQQILGLMLLMDLLQYAVHRWLHGRALWPFHAIHHAPTTMDWHHAARFHPVNYLLYITFTSAVCLLIGFPMEVLIWLAPFNMAYSLMVHANLNWRFGPLRYVLASPVFHRWHHSDEPEAAGKNLSPTFPFIDLIFGTFYMPNDRQPLTLGAPGADVPEGIWKQMHYPFVKAGALLNNK